MKILIHGRKNGYTVLYPKPTPLEFYSYASDIQSISANNYDLYYGKKFYVLAFAESGCIFTKYVIGDDVERGQLGEIGISVFIPIDQILSGRNVKHLLDELNNTFCNNYIIDKNKIVEPKYGFDWLLFTSIANNYDTKLVPRSDEENIITAGTQDPAFHYYKTESELEEHFDKPFQEEYGAYRQIYFIDNNLKGEADPLNVLRNSGNEVNPDLSNETYFLNNFNKSKGVIITANGKQRSEEKYNNQIRAKWFVEIKYTKNYYKPIIETGTLSNPESGIYKYLEKKGRNIKIIYDAFAPNPETKTFTFEAIRKRDGEKVNNIEIQINNEPWQNLSEITFSAEDLGREHTITARKSNKLFSDAIKITPINYPASSIPLQMREKQVVKIIALDKENSNNIWPFKIQIKGKDIHAITDEVTFIDDEIDKEWNIKISKEYFTSDNRRFCPAKDRSDIIFNLTRNNKQKTGGNKHLSSGYQLSNNGENQTSVFNKVLYKRIVLIVLGVLILILTVWTGYAIIIKERQIREILLSKEQIEKYVEGDSLMIKKLDAYKDNWENQEQRFIAKSGGGFFGGGDSFDSTEWKNKWKPTYENIKLAIKKRNYINKKNFLELRKMSYSDEQLPFKRAIEKIDSIKFKEVGEQLGDISSLTLTQISVKINDIIKINEQEIIDTLNELREEEKQTNSKNEMSGLKEHRKKQPEQQEQKPSLPDKTSEILQYINGSELDKTELERYKNISNLNQNIKASIQLCLDFWELDGSGNGKKSKTYWSLREKVSLDNNLKNSNLKAFLDEIQLQGGNPSYSDQDKKKGLK